MVRVSRGRRAVTTSLGSGDAGFSAKPIHTTDAVRAEHGKIVETNLYKLPAGSTAYWLATLKAGVNVVCNALQCLSHAVNAKVMASTIPRHFIG